MVRAAAARRLTGQRRTASVPRSRPGTRRPSPQRSGEPQPTPANWDTQRLDSMGRTGPILGSAAPFSTRSSLPGAACANRGIGFGTPARCPTVPDHPGCSLFAGIVRPQHPADRTSGDQEDQRMVASSPGRRLPSQGLPLARRPGWERTRAGPGCGPGETDPGAATVPGSSQPEPFVARRARTRRSACRPSALQPVRRGAGPRICGHLDARDWSVAGEGSFCTWPGCPMAWGTVCVAVRRAWCPVVAL
jgi:hypothetical protein